MRKAIACRRGLLAVTALALTGAASIFTAAPASASDTLTCNGGYTATGPMGDFRFSVRRSITMTTDGHVTTGSAGMTITYSGANGYSLQRFHSSNNGVLSFTDQDQAPGLWQGVTATYTIYEHINGQDMSFGPYVASCNTYAQSPAPTPEQPTTGPEQPALPALTPHSAKPPRQTTAAVPSAVARSSTSAPGAATPAPTGKPKKAGSASAPATVGTASHEPTTTATNYTTAWILGGLAVVGAIGFVIARVRRRLY